MTEMQYVGTTLGVVPDLFQYSSVLADGFFTNNMLNCRRIKTLTLIDTTSRECL